MDQPTTPKISKSNQKILCPFCLNWGIHEEIQHRYIFNHIVKKHNLDYLKYVKNIVNLDLHIANKSPFSINMLYQSDSDPADINLKIFGCLGCNAGITNCHEAEVHCNKDKCRVKHVSELRKLRALLKTTVFEDEEAADE